MVSATTTSSPIPEAIPERVEQELQASAIILPERSNVTIKLAKQHPVADVISALSHFMLFMASSAITVMFAKRQIESGSSFGTIQMALDVIERLNRR